MSGHTKAVWAANIGVGVHTGLRKACDSEGAARAWRALSELNDDDWQATLMYVVDGLTVMGMIEPTDAT